MGNGEFVLSVGCSRPAEYLSSTRTRLISYAKYGRPIGHLAGSIVFLGFLHLYVNLTGNALLKCDRVSHWWVNFYTLGVDASLYSPSGGSGTDVELPPTNAALFLSQWCHTVSIIEWTDMVAAGFVFFLVDQISNGRAFIISTSRHVLILISLTP